MHQTIPCHFWSSPAFLPLAQRRKGGRIATCVRRGKTLDAELPKATPQFIVANCMMSVSNMMQHMLTTPRSDVADIFQVCRFIARHPKTEVNVIRDYQKQVHHGYQLSCIRVRGSGRENVCALMPASCQPWLVSILLSSQQKILRNEVDQENDVQLHNSVFPALG